MVLTLLTNSLTGGTEHQLAPLGGIFVSEFPVYAVLAFSPQKDILLWTAFATPNASDF